jgi:ribosomal protein S18 acetylase RimI-like enzyme
MMNASSSPEPTQEPPKKKIKEEAKTYTPKRDMPNARFSIKWSMESSLDSRRSLEDAGIDSWYGTLSFYSCDDDKDLSIGRIKAYKIAGCGILSQDDYNYVFDCHSDELAEFATLFDEFDGFKEDIVNEVGDRYEICQGTKLYVTKLLIQPEYRGLGLGLYMIDEACRKINDSISLTVLCPASLDNEGHPNKLGDEWMAAHRKLKAYYKLIGMVPLGEKFVARWNGNFYPKLYQVCPHLFE